MSQIPKEIALKLYEQMLRIHLFEENLHLLYRKGEILGGLYTGSGNEAVSVGAAMPLEKGDVIAPSHRGMGAHFVRGETFLGMMLQLLARKDGGTKGKDNAAHQGSMERGVIGMISHLGVTATTAAGCALAQKILQNKGVSIGFVGEGTTSLGEFHETMNMAATLNLPFIMIIENNQFAYSTPISRQYRCSELAKRAEGYGMAGSRIDGCDVELVYLTVKEAVERARRGSGPTLIEAVTMRLRGHSAADMAEYVPQEMLDEWSSRHPVHSYEKILIERKWIGESQIAKMKQEISNEIDKAVEQAKASPYPEGWTASEGVYAP